MSWMAVAVGGSAALGYLGSQNAADTQAGAADRASQVQQKQFDTTQNNLQPYMQGGTTSLSALMQLLGLSPGTPGTPAVAGTEGHYITQAGSGGTDRGGSTIGGTQTWVPGTPGSPGTPGTQAGFNPNAPLAKPFSLSDFQASPAYNFNLEQGMNAINKGAAARGNLYAPQTLQDLGKFAQGTASNEFQNAFSNYNVNQNNLFSRLQTLSSGGQNAAANLGGIGAQTAGQIGGNIVGAGNAQAAGTIGGVNAISGGVGDYYNHQLMQQILAQQQAPTYGVNNGASRDAAIFPGS